MNPQHKKYLQIALQQAADRRGFCAPNPAVGAVVVKNNRIIATGTHWAAGYPHAEVDALNKVTADLQGAILYVTLEPCCHHGKTPPCTDLIIQSKIAEVYYGFHDSNPLVAGKGRDKLLAAGIQCQQLALPSIDEFYQSYHYWQRTRLPWVTAKLALSSDGKIAGPQGQPVQITGEECQRFTHENRKKNDAILTTATTIIHDDPQLNVRLDDEVFSKPIYVLDRQLRMPLTSRILQTASQLTVFYDKNCTQTEIKLPDFLNHHIRCIPVSVTQNKLNLREILKSIGADGVHDLWVEAGGKCFQSFFSQQLFNRAFLYVSPKNLGENAQPAFTDEFDLMQNNFSAQDLRRLGEDWVHVFP